MFFAELCLGGLRPEAYYMQFATAPAGVEHP